MPGQIKIMDSRPLQHIADQIEAIFEGDHLPAMADRELECSIAIMRRSQQIKALALHPTVDTCFCEPIPGKRGRRSGLIAAVNGEGVMDRSAAQEISLGPGTNVFKSSGIDQQRVA